MGSGDQLAIAQIHQSPDQPYGILHILRAIIDPGNEMGMHITGQPPKVDIFRCRFSEKGKHGVS